MEQVKITGEEGWLAPDPRSPTAEEKITSEFAHAGRSRVRSATMNVFSAQLYTIATMAIGLLSTPLLLRWLGSERFGILRILEVWTTCLGIPSYCMVLASSIR